MPGPSSGPVTRWSPWSTASSPFPHPLIHGRPGRLGPRCAHPVAAFGVVKVVPGAAGLLRFGLVQVPASVGQLLADQLLQAGEGAVAGRVLRLDDLEGPVPGDDVAASRSPS